MDVGDFMGLLLGASCMTIIEVIDFFAMLVIKKGKTCTVVPQTKDIVVVDNWTLTTAVCVVHLNYVKSSTII